MYEYSCSLKSICFPDTYWTRSIESFAVEKRFWKNEPSKTPECRIRNLDLGCEIMTPDCALQARFIGNFQHHFCLEVLKTFKLWKWNLKVSTLCNFLWDSDVNFSRSLILDSWPGGDLEGSLKVSTGSQPFLLPNGAQGMFHQGCTGR